jgi:hypothetical protein
MGFALETLGALSVKVQTGEGVDPVPTMGLALSGQPTYTHNDNFPEEDQLSLSAGQPAPDREHVSQGVSATSYIGPKQDIDGEGPAVADLLRAGGCAMDVATGAGTGPGTFVRFTPKTSGFEVSTFYGYLKEDGSGKLALLKMLDAKLNWTLTMQAALHTLQFDALAKHAFWEKFDAAAVAPANIAHGLGRFKKCTTLTINGEAFKFVSYTLTPNHDISVPEDEPEQCGEDGASEIILTPGTPGGQMVLLFDEDLIADDPSARNILRDSHAADVDHEIICRYEHSGVYYQAKIPKARITTHSMGTQGNRKTLQLDYLAQPTAGNDEFELEWGYTGP